MKVKTKKEALEFNKRAYDGEFGDKYAKEGNPKALRRSQTYNLIMRKVKSRKPLILDIGCGTGEGLDLYRERGIIYNLDLSKNMLILLRNRLNLNDLRRSRFICRDAHCFLSKTQHQFDVITGAAILHHLFDYLEVVDLACKKLKDNGFLYIVAEGKNLGKLGNYAAKTLEIWDRAFFRQQKREINKVMFVFYLCYAPFNFLSPITQFFRNLFNPSNKDYLGSEVIKEGLDFEKIEEILKDNNMKIVGFDDEEYFMNKSFYKTATNLGLNRSFSLVAQKHGTRRNL